MLTKVDHETEYGELAKTCRTKQPIGNEHPAWLRVMAWLNAYGRSAFDPQKSEQRRASLLRRWSRPKLEEAMASTEHLLVLVATHGTRRIGAGLGSHDADSLTETLGALMATLNAEHARRSNARYRRTKPAKQPPT